MQKEAGVALTISYWGRKYKHHRDYNRNEISFLKQIFKNK